MKLYDKWSIFRFKALRRLIYGRGHGVHSPSAFHIIRSIIRPLSKYYAEDEFQMSQDELLLFRMISRFDLTTLCIMCNNSVNKEVLLRAKSNLHFSTELGECHDKTILYTDNPCTAAAFSILSKGPILLTNIRRSKDSEAAFKVFSTQIKRGCVIDIYDAAFFVYLPDVVYLYRSTM